MIEVQNSLYEGAAGGNILIEIYEYPDVPFSSYTVIQRLNPKLRITAPEYRTALVHVSSAIEKCIVSGLMRGKRSRNDDGVFFNNLKLTHKGERAAIRMRESRELPRKVERIMDFVELIRERDRAAKA